MKYYIQHDVTMQPRIYASARVEREAEADRLSPCQPAINTSWQHPSPLYRLQPTASLAIRPSDTDRARSYRPRRIPLAFLGTPLTRPHLINTHLSASKSFVYCSVPQSLQRGSHARPAVYVRCAELIPTHLISILRLQPAGGHSSTLCGLRRAGRAPEAQSTTGWQAAHQLQPTPGQLYDCCQSRCESRAAVAKHQEEHHLDAMGAVCVEVVPGGWRFGHSGLCDMLEDGQQRTRMDHSNCG